MYCPQILLKPKDDLNPFLNAPIKEMFFLCNDQQGKKNKVRVYYLAWLRNKILHNDPEVEKKQGWTTVGEMEGCVHYKVGE